MLDEINNVMLSLVQRRFNKVKANSIVALKFNNVILPAETYQYVMVEANGE